MNMMKTVKILVCAMMLTTIFIGSASASVDSEQNRYNTANEKQFQQMENSFKSQYKHFAGQKNVIVISSSANF